eukprot:1965731-Rhodomonas_salina.2
MSDSEGDYDTRDQDSVQSSATAGPNTKSFMYKMKSIKRRTIHTLKGVYQPSSSAVISSAANFWNCLRLKSFDSSHSIHQKHLVHMPQQKRQHVATDAGSVLLSDCASRLQTNLKRQMTRSTICCTTSSWRWMPGRRSWPGASDVVETFNAHFAPNDAKFFLHRLLSTIHAVATIVIHESSTSLFTAASHRGPGGLCGCVGRCLDEYIKAQETFVRLGKDLADTMLEFYEGDPPLRRLAPLRYVPCRRLRC